MTARRKPFRTKSLSERQARLRAAAVLLAGILFAHAVAIGANSAFLAIAGDLLILSAAIVIMVLTDPPIQYWRMTWPVWLLLFAIVTWGNLPASALGRAIFPFLARAYAGWLTPDLAVYGLCRMLGALAFLLVGSWIGYRRGGLRLFVALLMVAGMFDLGLGLALRQYDPLHVWGYDKGIHVYRFTGTMLNANASGCLFGITSILALGLFQDQLANRVRNGLRSLQPIALVIAMVASYGGCAITQSRTALALTTAAFAVLLLCDPQSRQEILRRRNMVGLIGVAGLIVALSVTLGDTSFQRFALLDRDGAERIMIWSHYLRLAQTAPLMGYGPGSFEMASMRSLATPNDALLLWFVNSAHNEAIGLVIERGWPFLCLTVWAVAAMLVPFYRARKHHSAVANCTFAALCLVAGESLVDIVLDVPALQAYALTLIGALWGHSLRSGGRPDDQAVQPIIGSSGRTIT